MIRRLARLAFVACVVLVACASAGMWHVTPPADRPLVAIRRIDAHRYRPLWQDIEHCTGVRADFNSVRWYATVDSVDSFLMRQGPAYGVAYARERVIVLARKHMADTAIIRHEAMHLIGSPFYHDPDQYQRGPCASLMACWANCLTDTLPPHLQPRR